MLTKHSNYIAVVTSILIFIVMDQAMLSFAPSYYKQNSDYERYHTEYFTIKMKKFEALKQNIDTVFIGDSRTEFNISPRELTGQTRLNTPTAFNLATGSAGVELISRITSDYLIDLPKLKTVVWGVSPRIFNKAWKSSVNKRFGESLGYHYQQQRLNDGLTSDLYFEQLASLVSGSYAQRSIIKPIILDHLFPLENKKRFEAIDATPVDNWGFMPLPQRALIDTADKETQEKYIKDHRRGWFKLEKNRMEHFKEVISILQEKDIDLVVFFPPMHYSLSQVVTSDHDLTPDKTALELSTLLKSLEKKYTNFVFYDLNNDGNNGFADEDWGNYDHLNIQGARKFTQIVDNILRESKHL